MTYKQAIDTALKLIDSEYDEFDEGLYPFYADTAQKMIAMYGKHIERLKTIEKPDNTEVEVELDNFYKLNYTVIRGSKAQVNYILTGNKLTTDSAGTVDIYYFAMPETVTGETDDEYQFEVDIETHNAIPYYIGYALAKSDDPATAQMLFNEWNRYMSVFVDEPKVVVKKMRNVLGR